MDRDVVDAGERIAQHGLEPDVDLDGVHEAGGPGDRDREGADAGADLEHHIVGTDPRLAHRKVGEVLVQEEVLAELRVGSQAVRLQQACRTDPVGATSRRLWRRWRW